MNQIPPLDVSGVTDDYAQNVFEQIWREFSIDTSVMMTKDEFISCDKNLECSEVFTNEEILDIVQGKEEEVEEYDNELLSVPALPPTTSKEARDAIETLSDISSRINKMKMILQI